MIIVCGMMFMVCGMFISDMLVLVVVCEWLLLYDLCLVVVLMEIVGRVVVVLFVCVNEVWVLVSDVVIRSVWYVFVWSFIVNVEVVKKMVNG